LLLFSAIDLLLLLLLLLAAVGYCNRSVRDEPVFFFFFLLQLSWHCPTNTRK
jgi:hypothetical protein